MNFELSLGFDDVAIKQQKNICKSRLDVDISSEIIKGVKVKIPLIAANMSSVINSNFLIEIMRLGAFGFLHRALPDEEYFQQVHAVAKESKWVPVSIGVGESQYLLAKKLISEGANVVLIDVAHGYADTVIELGRRLKKEYPHIKMVVGNTTNIGLLQETCDFADAVKVGIGQGSACETKDMAGSTEKQFTAVLQFKEISRAYGIPVISDGGIRVPGDFSKAIGAGAMSAMCGSIFARCPESAAEHIYDSQNGHQKVYFGMASRRSQDNWKGGLKPGTCSEGKVVHLPMGQPVEDLLERYAGGLRSGITYGGGKDIKSFQQSVQFVRFK